MRNMLMYTFLKTIVDLPQILYDTEKLETECMT